MIKKIANIGIKYIKSNKISFFFVHPKDLRIYLVFFSLSNFFFVILILNMKLNKVNIIKITSKTYLTLINSSFFSSSIFIL